MTGRVLVAAAAVVAVAAVPAGAAYRNPTPGREVVLQLPGMHRAQVIRGLVYRRAARTPLRLDVYRPRGAPRARRLPVVLVGGPPAFSAGRLSGQKMGWAQLIAASGLAAAAFDIRSDNFLRTPRAPTSDVAAAIAFLRARGSRLGLDPERICTLGFSIGTAPWHLAAAMREPLPYVRCNVSYYGPLDFRDLADRFSADRGALEEYEAAGYLRRHGASIPPLLIARAGRDDEGINRSIDRFVADARERGAPVELLTHATGPHGFDIRAPGAASQGIMRRTLAFFRRQLLTASYAAVAARPLQLVESCVTRAERRRVVRFTAPDRARLVGVLLGSGRKAVVLAHQGGGGAPGNLCAWMPYARRLSAAGYRVLAFDHRGFASSPYVVRRTSRVDLDVMGAVKFLRGRGVTDVVLGGASLGGAAVVAAGANIRPPVRGVFTVGATHTYESVDALAASKRLTVPVLFVAAEDDAGGQYAQEAREMHAAAPSTDKRLVIYPGSAHGAPQLRNRRPRELVDAWIRDHLATTPSYAALGGWERIEPGGRTSCARGGRYAFWLRRGDPKRVVIFFQGGGGCFDARSCAPGSTWFDDRVDAQDDPGFQGGLLDLADARNPFRGSSFLFVPSCTGDVHMGDRVMRYGSTTIRHRGWPNSRAALARAFREFPAPEQVLVTGCSAGSVGSAFHVPVVLGRWPRAKVTQLGDSLAFIFHRPIRLVDWGAHARFPGFFRIGARRFTMVEYLTALAKRYPRRTFARFNYASDGVQERFYEAVGGRPSTFEPRLRRAETQLKRLRNYRSYLACGGEHCVLPFDSFFTLRVAGVSLRAWVQRLAAGQNVGCPTCRG